MDEIKLFILVVDPTTQYYRRKTHEKDHGKENKCKICGAEYAWPSGLWKHINKIKKDRGKYDEKPQSSIVPYILHI